MYKASPTGEALFLAQAAVITLFLLNMAYFVPLTFNCDRISGSPLLLMYLKDNGDHFVIS